MPNDENKIILEFPSTNVEIELGETITFDNISGFLDAERVTYNGESLTEKITHLENDKADTTYVNTELAKKADKTDTYTKTQVDNALNNKMDKAHPTGTGSFSLNRKANTTIGYRSVATGYNTTASGMNSHSEGVTTTSSGMNSHSEGATTTASGNNSHSEGFSTTASGNQAHSEGTGTIASGNNSHSEGFSTTASGNQAHSEGTGTIASGNNSHSEGVETTASGERSHAEGLNTEAKGNNQHVSGKYNIVDNNDEYAEIIGNGTSGSNRSNARTLDWDGNETLAGDLIINGNQSVSGEITRLDGRIDNLPAPMIFKGTLGVGGTIQTLPTASASNEGFTYKVITDGTYAGQTAKVGDVFTSNGSAWVYIPSGDEDNDTWRNIKVNGVEKLSNGISSGAVDFEDTTNVKFEFDANGNKVRAKLDGIYTDSEVDDLLDDKADADNTYTKEQVDDIVYNILPDDTASGSVANFNTSLELPIKSLDIDVNAVQASGTPTPATPLPISGWNEIKFGQTGTNIWNGVTELGSFDTTTGEKVANNNLLRSVNPIPVKPNVTYMRLIDASLGFRVFYYDKNMNFLSTEVSQYTQLAITIPSDCYYMNIAYQKAIASVSINYPSTDTSFRAYNPNGTTEVINLGGTYYGGHFTQDKDGHRQFEVTHGIVELSSLTDWSRITNYTNPFFRATLPNACKVRTASNNPQIAICDSYSWFNSNQNYWQYINNYEFVTAGFGVSSVNRVYIRNDNYDNKDSFVSSLSGVYLVYELATPIIIDLPDGEPIITLNGTNNIYADTGDTSVVFKSSVNDYVSAHSGGNLLGMGGVYLGGAKSGGSEEEPTEESEDTEKTKLDEPKEEIKTIGDTKKIGGE